MGVAPVLPRAAWVMVPVGPGRGPLAPRLRRPVGHTNSQGSRRGINFGGRLAALAWLGLGDARGSGTGLVGTLPCASDETVATKAAVCCCLLLMISIDKQSSC